MAKKSIPQKKNPKDGSNVDDLEQFIQKKKIQNNALKKIIKKINNDSNK